MNENSNYGSYNHPTGHEDDDGEILQQENIHRPHVSGFRGINLRPTRLQTALNAADWVGSPSMVIDEREEMK